MTGRNMLSFKPMPMSRVLTKTCLVTYIINLGIDSQNQSLTTIGGTIELLALTS